jgi:multimeric flavodoxin WrbA
MTSQVKVLGLHFSPRKDGSSGVLLERFREGAVEAGADFTLLSVSDHPEIKGCQECGACDASGECRFRDDMDVFYEAWEKADRIVVGSSIFFYDIPAQGKAVIDRSQAFWARRYRLGQHKDGKPGAKGFLLAVGATKGSNLFTPATLSIRYFFDSLAYPKDFDTLFFSGVEGPQHLTEEQKNMAREAGRNFVSR